MSLNEREIKELIEPYDKCHLECDGLTRVLHKVLHDNGVRHDVYIGSVEFKKDKDIPLHYWIELPSGKIIDYRARMWLGNQAPHGIFRINENKIRYEGKKINMPLLSDFIFSMLTSDCSIAREAKIAYRVASLDKKYVNHQVDYVIEEWSDYKAGLTKQFDKNIFKEWLFKNYLYWSKKHWGEEFALLVLEELLSRPQFHWAKNIQRQVENKIKRATVIKISGIRGGDCYEAAGRYITDNLMFSDKDNLILVHGIVTGQGPLEGVEYGHAWVEDGDRVIDKSNGRDLNIPKDVYYMLGKIDKNKTYRYNIQETRRKIVDSGHWGPWDLKSKY